MTAPGGNLGGLEEGRFEETTRAILAVRESQSNQRTVRGPILAPPTSQASDGAILNPTGLTAPNNKDGDEEDQPLDDNHPYVGMGSDNEQPRSNGTRNRRLSSTMRLSELGPQRYTKDAEFECFIHTVPVDGGETHLVASPLYEGKVIGCERIVLKDDNDKVHGLCRLLKSLVLLTAHYESDVPCKKDVKVYSESMEDLKSMGKWFNDKPSTGDEGLNEMMRNIKDIASENDITLRFCISSEVGNVARRMYENQESNLVIPWGSNSQLSSGSRPRRLSFSFPGAYRLVGNGSRSEESNVSRSLNSEDLSSSDMNMASDVTGGILGLQKIFKVSFCEAESTPQQSILVVIYQVEDEQSKCIHFDMDKKAVAPKVVILDVLKSFISFIENSSNVDCRKVLNVSFQSKEDTSLFKGLWEKPVGNRSLKQVIRQVKGIAEDNLVDVVFNTSPQGENVAQNLYSAGKSSFVVPQFDSNGVMMGLFASKPASNDDSSNNKDDTSSSKRNSSSSRLPSSSTTSPNTSTKSTSSRRSNSEGDSINKGRTEASLISSPGSSKSSLMPQTGNEEQEEDELIKGNSKNPEESNIDSPPQSTSKSLVMSDGEREEEEESLNDSIKDKSTSPTIDGVTNNFLESCTDFARQFSHSEKMNKVKDARIKDLEEEINVLKEENVKREKGNQEEISCLKRKLSESEKVLQDEREKTSKKFKTLAGFCESMQTVLDTGDEDNDPQ